MDSSRRSFIKTGGLTIGLFGISNSLLGCAADEPQARLENMVSGVKPLEKEDFDTRIAKAQSLMSENDIDALFLSGSVSLKYFTNVSWGRSERTFGAVIGKNSDPIWVCPGFERERAEERTPHRAEVRTWEEHESPYRIIGGIMKDIGAGSGKLALGPTVRSFVTHGLRKDAPGLELVDGAVVTEGCRGIKTEKEIAFMDLANKITKIAYREGFKQLQAGMTRSEMSGIFRNLHSEMGVSGGIGGQFGPNSAFPHGSNVPRDLHDGDIVLCDGGCSVEGYRSDVSRTIVFGNPTDRQIKIWNIVKKAQTAALNAVRPGIACEVIDRTARKVVEDEGFGPDYTYFTHRLGHGIGMEGHEYPYLVRGNKLILQPGMTFSNEPGIYIYGEFGVRIEDCMVVTEDGGRHLGGMESTAIDQPVSGE